jgi:16S rRNA G966 N2-methylase RsmD
VFVEKDRGKRAVLQRNLDFVQQRTEVHLLPVEHFLRRGRNRFDRIFLDPPFRQRGKLEVLQLIAVRGILAPDGLLVIHLSKEEETHFPVDFASRGGDETGGASVQAGSGLCLSDRRLYGGSLLLFYRRGADSG